MSPIRQSVRKKYVLTFWEPFYLSCMYLIFSIQIILIFTNKPDGKEGKLKSTMELYYTGLVLNFEKFHHILNFSKRVFKVFQKVFVYVGF